MDRGPVDRSAVFPDGEPVGDGEGFAVADDHPADAVVGHPGDDPGVDTHPRQADLVAGSLVMMVGERRQLLFVRSPAHFGRGNALFAEALDAPGIDEFAHFLGPVGDLRVALAAMDHLYAQLHGEAIEGLVVDELPDFVGVLDGHFPVVE